jgi:hypothetical protein
LYLLHHIHSSVYAYSVAHFSANASNCGKNTHSV